MYSNFLYVKYLNWCMQKLRFNANILHGKIKLKRPVHHLLLYSYCSAKH